MARGAVRQFGALPLENLPARAEDWSQGSGFRSSGGSFMEDGTMQKITEEQGRFFADSHLGNDKCRVFVGSKRWPRNGRRESRMISPPPPLAAVNGR